MHLDSDVHVHGAAYALASSALPVGSRLAAGRFELLRRIGRGASGVVYAARDGQRAWPVALKLLDTVDGAAIYRLKNEFRSLADVRSPHLVRLHELFADDQSWFFTMELIDGRPWNRWATGGRRQLTPSGEQRLRHALRQLASAVRAMHAAGKLHRDLKPRNVLVERGGRVVVLDFGLVADLDARGVGRALADARISGTPAYMAPEQASGANATRASDWYAVGCMLFEALTGRLPFLGGASEILASKQRDHAPSPADLASRLPLDLVRLCVALLARDPAERPDGDEIAARLGLATSHLTVPVGATLQDAPALIGRGPELAALRAAFRDAVEGARPVVVMLSGESGIGKSALMSAFIKDLPRVAPTLLLQGRCFAREAVPFNAFDLAIDDLCRHLVGMSRDEAAGLAPPESAALCSLFPVLATVPVLGAAARGERADPHETRRSGIAALGRLLGALRQRTPMLLYVDDLQWVDADSVALLAHLLRQPDAPRLLFVGSHRSDDSSVLRLLYDQLERGARLDLRKLELGPLSARHAARLSGGVLPKRVVKESNGNPFLLRVLARAARSSRTGAPRSLSLARALAIRCATLPPSAQRLLRTVALCAGPVASEIAARATEAGPDAFEALHDAQLIRTARGGQLECYHDRIRETVCAAISRAEAKRLHAALADVLSANADPDVERLTFHCEHAGQRARTAVFARAAARRAAAVFGFERAAALLEKARRFGDYDRPARLERERERADALAQAGRGLDAAQVCVQGMRGVSPRAAADLARRAGGFYLQAGWLSRAMPLVNRGLARYGFRLPTAQRAAAEALGRERARLRARGLDPRRRRRNPAVIERLSAVELITWSVAGVDPLRAALLGTRMLRLALDSGDVTHLARAMALQVYVGFLLGHDESTQRDLSSRAHELCSRSGDAFAASILAFCVGCMELLFDPVSALSHMDRAIDMIRASPTAATSYLRGHLGLNRLVGLYVLGRYREIADAVPALLDDAWSRSDFALIPQLAGGVAATARIAVGDIAETRRDLARARAHAARDPLTWQALMLARGEQAVALAEGRRRHAWRSASAMRAQLAGAPARGGVLLHRQVELQCSVAGIAYAESLRGARPRAQVMHAVRACLNDIRTLPGFYRAHARTSEAALAQLQRSRDDAIVCLRTLLANEQASRSAPAYVTLARWRLGQLLADSEGAKLIARADAELRAGGVRDPERFVALVAPGFDS